MKRTLILGGPGAGKTTRLLEVMERALARGVKPDRIAFCAFTNAAADEARVRACQKFSLAEDQLPYFRTLHSLCFRELGLNHGQVLAEEHLAELAEITGELSLGDADAMAEGPATDRSADPLLTVDHYARTTRRSLRDAWEDHGGKLDWFRLQRFSTAYEIFKEDHYLLDFTDMLFQFVDQGHAVPVDVAIVDEAQDLTQLQWDVVWRAFGDVPELWVAGDDDQAIHEWAGADKAAFLSLRERGFQVEVLPRSHRLPREIFQLGVELAGRIGHRYEKVWAAAEHAGRLEWVGRPSDVDLSHGTWLLLARTRRQLAPLVELARDQGVLYRLKGASSVDAEHVRAIQVYETLRAGKGALGPDAQLALRYLGRAVPDLDEYLTYGWGDLLQGVDSQPLWHDALVKIPLAAREYYLACLRRGERLTQPPRVRIETIHGAKGAEAESVLLVTDLTYRTQRGYELEPDREHRVFYVGVTRAAKELYLLAPQSAYAYPL